MSKSANSGSAASSNPDGLPFEEALKKLEAIVEEMESDDLSLDKLLARFEEGTRLAKMCQSKLADAELKIQQLEKSQDGALTVKPLNVTDAED